MHPFLLATSWSPVLLVQHIIWCLRCKVWQLSKWKQSVFFFFGVHGETLLPLSHYAEWRNEHSLFLPRPKFKPSSNCSLFRVKEWAFIIFDCGIIDQNSPLALRSTLDWCFVEPSPLFEGHLVNLGANLTDPTPEVFWITLLKDGTTLMLAL